MSSIAEEDENQTEEEEELDRHSRQFLKYAKQIREIQVCVRDIWSYTRHRQPLKGLYRSQYKVVWLDKVITRSVEQITASIF